MRTGTLSRNRVLVTRHGCLIIPSALVQRRSARNVGQGSYKHSPISSNSSYDVLVTRHFDSGYVQRPFWKLRRQDERCRIPRNIPGKVGLPVFST